MPEHSLPVLGLCLRPEWMQLSLLFSFSISLLFLATGVARDPQDPRFQGG